MHVEATVKPLNGIALLRPVAYEVREGVKMLATYERPVAVP